MLPARAGEKIDDLKHINATHKTYIYRVSDNFLQSRSVKVDWLKVRRKVLYCFAIFAIINEKLIKKDQPILASISARRSDRRSLLNVTLMDWLIFFN